MDQTEPAEIFFGTDVDDAVSAGLKELGLMRDQVEVEILDEGNRGILGIGSREARVRLTAIPTPSPEAEPEPAQPPIPAPQPAVPAEPEPPAVPAEPEPLTAVAQPEPAPAPEEPDIAEIGRSALRELLERMGFEAEIRIRRIAPLADTEEETFVLDIHGPGANHLIGRKEETVTALQRITRLIVGKQTARWANLVIDIEGYKQRREHNLRNLAERMATQAVESGRTVYLEPMSPYDRRIVHLTLRNHPDVKTESEGEGNRRRVTIVPRSA
jgi:spoIIIJ-associated protein